ncbi:hypothetical protein HNR65_003416 [Desulfosalsimonas propionicica]|uniref:Uncharacterized protein n=1 Tax=Desulfosalsimonas propionicica TaxID=332175 RepID=A0A7W0CCF7_9BACT|nr:hypothetical protein [Desulfosalsimonas propionicica]MBA2883059.1 hypothetical protein [Desulfosalsimonas propionicica]
MDHSMKKFSFNKEQAAKVAKEANAEEKQQVVNANELLKSANDSGTHVDEQEFLASISKPLASNIFNRNNNFSNISNISNEAGLNLKIEPMAECLHGKTCADLQAPGEQRPVCRIGGEPVFDLEQCPKGWWFK